MRKTLMTLAALITSVTFAGTSDSLKSVSRNDICPVVPDESYVVTVYFNGKYDFDFSERGNKAWSELNEKYKTPFPQKFSESKCGARIGNYIEFFNNGGNIVFYRWETEISSIVKIVSMKNLDGTLSNNQFQSSASFYTTILRDGIGSLDSLDILIERISREMFEDLYLNWRRSR